MRPYPVHVGAHPPVQREPMGAREKDQSKGAQSKGAHATHTRVPLSHVPSLVYVHSTEGACQWGLPWCVGSEGETA